MQDPKTCRIIAFCIQQTNIFAFRLGGDYFKFPKEVIISHYITQ